MKILYASALPIPIQNILEGKTEIEGFPAYFWPMYKLIQRGHDLRFVFWSNYDDPGHPLRVDWFDRSWIVANVKGEYLERGRGRRLLRDVRRLAAFYQAVRDEVSSGQYDMIYGHGRLASVAQVVGARSRVPVGVRWYGDSDFCCKTIEKHGRFVAAVKHPMNWLNYKLPYAFFLTTDDHSHGDLTYRAWARPQPPGPFFHWKTGIEFKDVRECRSTVPVPEREYIFYAGRFARWKGVENVIETLHHLHQQGRELDLYLAGQTEGGASSLEYIAELKKQISGLGLDGYVHFLGAVPQDTLRVLAHHAVATIIMHHIANIGNVFYEVMAAGGVIVTTDDGSVRQFIDDGVNGFVVEGPVQGACRVADLLAAPTEAARMRQEALLYARERFISLEDRFDLEADLVELGARYYQDEAYFRRNLEELNQGITDAGDLAAAVWGD